MKCEVCGRSGAEGHHIIFRSQSKAVQKFFLNNKWLCSKHHRGNNSPHKDKKVDLQYKQEYQRAVEELLIQDYYTPEALTKTLKMTPTQVARLTKLIQIQKEGYERDDLIKELCGGCFYL